MNALVDRLAQAKARPGIVEQAVRTALRDAIAWRIGGGAAPKSDAFAAAAVASARQILDAAGSDSAERSRALTVAQSLAKTFVESALGRRLMSVPSAQFVRLAPSIDGPDAIVRDRRRRLHAIVLKLRADGLDAGRTATAVAAATPLSLSDRLTPLTVHVFALTTRKRHTFERETVTRRIDTRVA